MRQIILTFFAIGLLALLAVGPAHSFEIGGGAGGGSGGGASLTTQEEGGACQTAVTTLNFAGAGATCAADGAGKATVTIPGGGGTGGTYAAVVLTSGSPQYSSVVGTDTWTLTASDIDANALIVFLNPGANPQEIIFPLSAFNGGTVPADQKFKFMFDTATTGLTLTPSGADVFAFGSPSSAAENEVFEFALVVSGGAFWVSTENGAPSSVSLAIDDLTDVTISGAADDEVLTYNSGTWGNTAITFPVNVSGIDAFVGGPAGPDTYTTVAAAYAAGARRVLIVSGTNFAESGSFAANNLTVFMGFNTMWALSAANNLVITGSNSLSVIGASDSDSPSQITFTGEAAGDEPLVSSGVSGGHVLFENVRINLVDGGSSTAIPLVDEGSGTNLTLKNVTLSLPDIANVGVVTTAAGYGVVVVDGLHLIGGGAALTNALQTDALDHWTNVSNAATWNTGGGSPGIYMLGGVLEGISSTTAMRLTLDAVTASDDMVASDIVDTGGGFILEVIGATGTSDYAAATNFIVGTLEAKGYAALANGRVKTSAAVSGDFNTISNVSLPGFTVASGDDFNTFSNCVFTSSVTVTGNDNTVTGGSTDDTITISGAANRTIVSGHRTNSAISDSGTGSVLTGNAIY